MSKGHRLEQYWRDNLTMKHQTVCSCGWQSAWEKQEDDAKIAFNEHVLTPEVVRQQRLRNQHTPLMPQGDK